MPGYVAVRVLAPDVDDVRTQLYVTVAAVPPVGVEAVQTSVPSETVTVPLIVAEPLARLTLTFTVYPTPTVDGSGVSDVIVVAVPVTTVRVPFPVTVPPEPVA